MGLVRPEQLNVVTIMPRASIAKLPRSALATTPCLAKHNPILIYDGESSARLKQFGQDVCNRLADRLATEVNTRLWYTLNLDNYQVADSARAYFEAEQLRSSTDTARGPHVHVHSVSSGFGFIGYHLGRSVLVDVGATTWAENPGYFLVQHLSTPDMVLHATTGTFDRRHIPHYQYDPGSGLYVQHKQSALSGENVGS